jgi:hypothetical protein
MKQDFNIIRIETSMDMGIGNRSKRWTRIITEDLEAGNVFDIDDHELTIMAIDENEMKFEYRGKTFSVNRHWQVLGTPEFGIPNERISVQGRYIFFFSNDSNLEFDWQEGYAADLVSQMNCNLEKGLLWKNIPLVQEWIHEMKDIAPYKSANINPTYKAHYISQILENDFIDKRETPRLFHSLCELYRVYVDFSYIEDRDDEYIKKNFDKYYFREVDRWIYKFAWIADDPAGKIALDCWNNLGCMLKVDPVQATPEWEKVIYEVEKEVDEELKDEPRGMGFCFSYWSAKRAALARRGIEWRSPSAMNPRVMFD